MAAARQNNYHTMSNGVVLSDHQGMKHLPKVKICNQILRLKAADISQFFGVVGSPLIESVRYAMIQELDSCVHGLSNWREIAAMVQGRTDHMY